MKKEFGYTDEWYKSRTVTQIIDNALTVEPKKGKKDNPTNGDMIKAMFPDGIPKDVAWTLQGDKGIDWWNAPYKRGEE